MPIGDPRNFGNQIRNQGCLIYGNIQILNNMVKDKTPEMTRALNRLRSFLKEHNLDPTVNWEKHPQYGKEYTKLINLVNLERDKLTLIYPTRDIKNEVKLSNFRNMKKNKKSAEEPVKEKKLKKTEKVEKKAPARKVATKYDYPLIDGREMTSEEKKKYRMEQRKLAAGKTPKAKKEEKVEKKPKAKKEEKVKDTGKASKTKKDKKKAKKEED